VEIKERLGKCYSYALTLLFGQRRSSSP